MDVRSNMQKNLKMQDEHGQILVSGALDLWKMIPPKIPKISGGVQPKKHRFQDGKPNFFNKKTGGRGFGWPLAWPRRGRAKRKELAQTS